MWVHGNALWVLAMSVRYHRGGWETRWRDASVRAVPSGSNEGGSHSPVLTTKRCATSPPPPAVRTPLGAGRRVSVLDSARGSAGGSSCAAATAARPRSAGSRASGRRPRPEAACRAGRAPRDRPRPETWQAILGAVAGPAAPVPRGGHLVRLQGLGSQAAAPAAFADKRLGMLYEVDDVRDFMADRPKPWRPANSQPRPSTTPLSPSWSIVDQCCRGQPDRGQSSIACGVASRRATLSANPCPSS